MTEQEYNEYPAIRRSALWKVLESPEKYKYSIDHPEEPTPALIFGQAFHTMALQPEEFDKQFAVLPNVDRRTKQGKAEYADFIEQNEGKAIITQDTFQQITEMCEKLNGNQFVKSLLKGAEIEKPYFWTDDITEEPCKVRVDAYNSRFEQPLIIDIKTTEYAENEAFMHSAIKYGYDLQAGMYTEGVRVNTGKKPDFVFIAIEKKAPYAINIFKADKLLVQRGEDLFRQAIGIYHDCKTTGNWFGYLGKFNELNNLGLPFWLAKEME